MVLADFLRENLGPAEKWNCSSFPADWCLALDHPDFAAEWRDVVDPDECEAVTREAGGLVRLWERGIGDALPVVSEPYQPGDIAVLAALGLEAGGIWTGEQWAIRRERGLFFGAPELFVVRKAWRP